MQKDTTKKLYEDIRKEHERLTNITQYGVQKHSDAWIRNHIADKFYKRVSTIEAIIFNRL